VGLGIGEKLSFFNANNKAATPAVVTGTFNGKLLSDLRNLNVI
jgi:hypothetical protein